MGTTFDSFVSGITPDNVNLHRFTFSGQRLTQTDFTDWSLFEQIAFSVQPTVGTTTDVAPGGASAADPTASNPFGDYKVCVIDQGGTYPTSA
eukprot:4612594-Prymnesium_polylepis.1